MPCIYDLDRSILTRILTYLYNADIMKIVFIDRWFYGMLYNNETFKVIIDRQFPGHVCTENHIKQYNSIINKHFTTYDLLCNKATMTTSSNGPSISSFIMSFREKNKNYSDIFQMTDYPVNIFRIRGNPVEIGENDILLSSNETEYSLLFKTRSDLINYIDSIQDNAHNCILRYEVIVGVINEYIQGSRTIKEYNRSIKDIINDPFFDEAKKDFGIIDDISPFTKENWYNYIKGTNKFYLDRDGDHYFYYILDVEF
jgi:hypothetical protein